MVQAAVKRGSLPKLNKLLILDLKEIIGAHERGTIKIDQEGTI